MSRPRPIAVAAVAGLVWIGVGGGARADLPRVAECRSLKVDFTPALEPYQPQIVAWLEDGSGNFLATAFITEQTGRYGLGNRPGRYDFNSGPLWPYGARVNVFPVWAHRQGATYPTVGYQLAGPDDIHECCDTPNDLSHSGEISSPEPHYCPPEGPRMPNVDAVSCASRAFTDKGVFDITTPSLYPPRADLGAGMVGYMEPDSASVAMYAAMNPFDAVTAATPAGNVPYEISYPISGYPDGDYVLQVEVSMEFDHNATYSVTAYPAPQVGFLAYGSPYRGQPSILFGVPFTLTGSDSHAEVLDYAGYGDPTGATGTLNPPDSTITTNVPGSGPNRLEVVADGSGNPYRVSVTAHVQPDDTTPGVPAALAATPQTSTNATLTFIEPGNAGDAGGPVASYQIRMLTDATIGEADFGSAEPIAATVIPVGPGTVQTVTIAGLLPLTPYSVGVRAVDGCGNIGPLAVASFTTPDREGGYVDACFVATAAYGSVMASDVAVLRRFRDLVLRHSVLGELFVEGYYTFGPPVAGVVGASELLRASARDALAPVIDRVRGLRTM